MNPIRLSSRAAQTARDLTFMNRVTLIQCDFLSSGGSLTSFGMTARGQVREVGVEDFK
jgi:hypothetical protein